MSKDTILSSIEDAVEDFRQGKFLIVVDDEDRENEGDFIIAAEAITPEKVNFMLANGRGVLCAPITMQRCEEFIPSGESQYFYAGYAFYSNHR